MSFNLIANSNENLQNNIVNLPTRVLNSLVEEDRPFPYFFRVTIDETIFYISVNQFTADNDEIEISIQMMEKYELDNNSIVQIDYIDVPLGNYIKLQPQDEAFFLIDDYEALLEVKLSEIPILYKNQIIYIEDYDSNQYSIKVVTVDENEENKENEENEQIFINTINQDLNVDIYNTFLEERLIQEKIQREIVEKQNEERERFNMKENDINMFLINVLSNVRQIPSREEIIAKRLKKFTKK